MHVLAIVCLLALLHFDPANTSYVQTSDVVPFYSHPGQGSHSRLGANKYNAGLLYQNSPINIKLTGETVILRQEVNFDILNDKMSTLNTFQESVTDKIKDLHNTSITVSYTHLTLPTIYSV